MEALATKMELFMCVAVLLVTLVIAVKQVRFLNLSNTINSISGR